MLLFQSLSSHPQGTKYHAHDDNHPRLISMLAWSCRIQEELENRIPHSFHLWVYFRIQTQKIRNFLHVVEDSFRKVPLLGASDSPIEHCELLIGIHIRVKGRVLGPDTPDITHYKLKEKNTEKKLLGRVVSDLFLTRFTMCAKRKEHREEVLGPSSWAGYTSVLGWAGYTRHHTHITSQKKKEHREPVLEPSSWAEFLGRIHQTSHITSRKKRAQRRSSWAEFLGRVLGPDVCVSTLCVSTLCVWALSPYHTSQAERREHKEEVLGPSSIITSHHIRQAETSKKHEFSCKNLVQEHCRTPKYENYHEKWTSKKLKGWKSTRITTRKPFQTLSRASQIT